MEPRRIDLADPDFEPTDEELRELSRRAFADVPQKNADAAARFTAEIDELRRAVLARIEPLLRAAPRNR